MGRRNYNGEMGSNTSNLYKKTGKGSLYFCSSIFHLKSIEMHKFRIIAATIALYLLQNTALGQAPDSAQSAVTTYSGSVGITNNGISFVPSFSLNSSAGIMLFFYGKGRFSFDPDIRIASDAKRGSLITWFRYRVVDKKRFSLRLGAHPGLNFITKNITDNGSDLKIIQARRYLAGEVVPNFQIKPNWSIGMYYLNGNALQKDGPQTTHFLTFNSSVSGVKLGGDFRFQILPAVYYLNVDGDGGYFFYRHRHFDEKESAAKIGVHRQPTLPNGHTGKRKLFVERDAELLF